MSEAARTGDRDELGAAPPRPLLLFFYSSTEGRSRRIDGFVAQVLQRRHNHDAFEIRRIDVLERPDLAERFRVTSLPTLLVVADRRIRARLDQPEGCVDIEQTLRPWLH